MLHRRSSLTWGGRIVALVLVGGLAAYLVKAGLDKADKIATVLVLFVAIVTLVAPYLLPPAAEPPADPSSRGESGFIQSVRNSVVGGDLTQVTGTGSVRREQSASEAAGITDGLPDAPGGQYVDGVWVAKNLKQVKGADGDVTSQ